MSPLKIVLLIVVILLLVGAFPVYGYVGPPGVFGLVLLIVLLLLLFGRL